MNKDRDGSQFLFSEDLLAKSVTLQTYKFTRVLFGMNCNPFLLATVIKHDLKNYTQKYSKTVDFLKKIIYIDNIIRSVSSVEQAFSTMLEAIENFKSSSMQLHKMHINLKALLES